MGRNKLPIDQKKKRHTFRLSKECKEQLQKEAKQKNTTMSKLLEQKIMVSLKVEKLQKIT